MRLLALFILFLLLGGCASTSKSPLNPDVEQRVSTWKQLIESGQRRPASEQLDAANAFVNQLVFVDDIVHWQQEDYWATPLETIVTGGGDCEDLAIAKYFTLKSMGMEESKLRLTYVKALSINKAHMVVSYYAQPNQTPLVLDNLNKRILPATDRNDLLPVYSFNGTGLWLNKQKQSSRYLDNADRISLWQKLLKTMDAEASNEAERICRYQYYDLPLSEAKKHCP
jgi:predicted transglutaminase-like cysteine proteinase